MKLLTFFVACLCQLGGTEVRCEEETGSQNACTIYLNIYFSETKKKTKNSHTKHETHNIPFWLYFFKTFAARPVVFVT